MQRIDYDQIAALYDEPIRDHPVDPNLVAFLEARSAGLEPRVRILDIGCGTGKQVASNRARFPDKVFLGLDRSRGMLRIAKGRCPAAAWLRADGARLPLQASCVAYATSQFSYHHVGRTQALLTEVFRVLQAGGRFVMTNIDPWSMQEWLIYQYFPEALDRDRQDFVPVEQFVALLRSAGFREIQVVRDDLSKRESVGAFLAFARERHRTSQLMILSDNAYAAGLRRLEEALAAGLRQDVFTVSQFVRVTLTGDKAATCR